MNGLYCPKCGVEMECIDEYFVGKNRTFPLTLTHGCTKCDRAFSQERYKYVSGAAAPVPLQSIKITEMEGVSWKLYKKRHPKERVIMPKRVRTKAEKKARKRQVKKAALKLTSKRDSYFTTFPNSTDFPQF